jgi:hypothetical protein
MARAKRPENERRNFYLYIDEFQNFLIDAFASILAEARKYCLCITISHQYIDQLSLPVRQAVFGNVGTLVASPVGHTDVEVLEKEFGNSFLRVPPPILIVIRELSNCWRPGPTENRSAQKCCHPWETRPATNKNSLVVHANDGSLSNCNVGPFLLRSLIASACLFCDQFEALSHRVLNQLLSLSGQLRQLAPFAFVMVLGEETDCATYGFG